MQWSLACNSPLYDTHPYDGDFDPQVETAVNMFKEFMTLPANGVADMPTTKQLLTSNGYTGRAAIACDASTVINQTTVNTRSGEGYDRNVNVYQGNLRRINGQPIRVLVVIRERKVRNGVITNEYIKGSRYVSVD